MNDRRRGIVVLLAALFGVAVTARLGLWQLDRAAQKTALQATLDSRRALPPLPAAELARGDDAAAAQLHRRVEVDGRWLPAHTVFLDNRQVDGRPGFVAVTPLLLADGSALVVQRGWLPRNFVDRSQVQAPPLPDGPVRVAGRIAPPPPRLYEFEGAAAGPIRQNLDWVAYAAELARPLRPVSLQQEDGPTTPADTLVRRWPQPATGVAKHYGYAFQWFALASLITGLYVWFQLIRPARRR